MALTDKALAGRTALVTGASRGIGRAIAIALGRRGAKVIINYASKEDAARETAAAVEAAGGQAAIAPFDVANSAAVTESIKAIGKDHGGLDILVNNAGVAVNGLLMRFTDEQWAKTLNTNLAGAFYCVRAASTLLLRAKDAGRIINITSVVGEMGNGGQAAYAASKAGLIGLTMSTAKELASRAVTCNAVAPGFIETDMTARIPFATREIGRRMNSLEQGGHPKDVAETIAWLAQPGAAAVTGQVVRVCGQSLLGA